MSTDSTNPRPLHKFVIATDKAAARAIELRHRQTPPEGILWSRLKSRKLAGLKFRRQHPIGPYIADFYCHEALLIVEVLGRCHDPQTFERDQARTKWLEGAGLVIVKISASRIPKDLPAVLRQIREAAERRKNE